MKPAVFLDRDGTVIEHVHHLADPDRVALIDRAAEAIARLQAAGYACVIVTNQSVVGRGMLTIGGLDEIHQVMDRQLAAHGVQHDGLYYCPEPPRGSGDQTTIEHPDRKPGPGMLQRAARELDLDLAASWMIGDALSDILAGQNAGCRGSILVLTGRGAEVDREHPAIMHVAEDLFRAVDYVLSQSRQGAGRIESN